MNFLRKYFLLFLVCSGIFFSCTKDIEVNVPDYEQKLVVEGAVEGGEAPYVFLSWTAPYFGNVEYTNYQQYFVKNAVVTVSDGFSTDTMKEYIPGTGYFYYCPNMLGVTGRTYNLNITVNGKNYTSSSTLLQPIPLDSLYFKAEVNDSMGYMWAHFKEPAGQGNQYRWYAKRIGKDNNYIAPMASAFDDKFIDGKEFDFAYDRGMMANSTAPDDNNAERGYFKAGDSVVVKYCHIGYKEYRYLRSYYQNIISNGNPFASPNTLESNISNGAIGMWCAYGASFKGIRLKQP